MPYYKDKLTQVERIWWGQSFIHGYIAQWVRWECILMYNATIQVKTWHCVMINFIIKDIYKYLMQIVHINVWATFYEDKPEFYNSYSTLCVMLQIIMYTYLFSKIHFNTYHCIFIQYAN